jgi:hypothetical protein
MVRMRKRLGQMLDVHYKDAMQGDIEEQKFIKDLVNQWHDLPANAPMRDDLDLAMAELGTIDPEAAALFRKGIATGGVDFKQ